MTMHADGKVAIVTGAGSGIGAAIARHLAGQGTTVVVADIDTSAGAAIAEHIQGSFVAVDLRQSAACRELVDSTARQFGRIDILVNNAGFQHISPIEDFPEDLWTSLLALMLTVPFLLTKQVWPLMKAQRWGRSINMSSIHGLLASPFKAGYISAKHGLIGLTRAAALEGGQYGITVNAICPGWTRTPLVEGQLHDLAQAQGVPFNEVLDRVGLAEAAIKRLIEPEEIAVLVGFLTSGAGAAITGSPRLSMRASPLIDRQRGRRGHYADAEIRPDVGEHYGGCGPVLHQTKAAANRLRQAPKRFTPAAGRHATCQCSDIDIVCRAVPN
jgi:3-hydroxybutyrate dehydrogenase